MFQYFTSLIRILNSSQKIKMAALQILFLISAVVQVGGIASIAPFIAVISNPSIVETNILLSFLYDYFQSDSLTEFLIIYATLVGAFILFSNIVGAIVLWLLFHFSVNTGAELQMRLYNNYMENEYIFFANNNSSTLISNLTMQIPRMVFMVIQPILLLVSQAFIVLIIIAGLLYIDPTLAISSSITVAGMYLMIYLTVRKKMESSGEILTEVAKQKLLLLNESIHGIKEVKLLDVEDWYMTEVDSTTRKGLNAAAFIGLAGDLPKFIVETIIFIAILGLAIYLITTQNNAGSAMSTLSLYAMAGYKLLPAAQTIYKAITSIKANGSVVNVIKKELITSTEFINQNSHTPNISLKNSNDYNIQLNNVSFKYPYAEQETIKSINLDISKNTIVAFVGGSGAGKSTVANIVLGLLKPTKGSLTIGKENIRKSNLKSWQSNIGYVPQSIFLLDDTIAKNIAFGIPPHQIDFEKLCKAAKKANIFDFIMQQEDSFNFKVGENGNKLSGGQRQRIGIARALYHDPKVLVLDEATSALDNITERNILNEIHKLKNSMTIIMIAHRLSTIENADKIFIFENGNIVADGTYRQLDEENQYFRSLSRGSSKSFAGDK